MADAAIPGEEIANLFRQAIRGEATVAAVGRSWAQAWAGNVVVRIAGYELVIFNDAMELDYVDSATAPDGRTGNFDTWFDAEQEPVDLLTDEEVATMEDILSAAPVVQSDGSEHNT